MKCIDETEEEKFLNDFMLAIVGKEKKSIDFMNIKFRKVFNKIPEEDLPKKLKLQKNRIGYINNLSDIEKRIVKARLKELVETNDASKSLPTNMAIVASILFICNMLFNLADIEDINSITFLFLLLLCGSVVLILIVNHHLNKLINYRKTAIYLNELLEDVLKITDEKK